MRVFLALAMTLFSSGAFAEFTCEKDGHTCPDKLCVKDTPDYCTRGFIATQVNGITILNETTSGSSKGALKALRPAD